jgi:hypothetical protein
MLGLPVRRPAMEAVYSKSEDEKRSVHPNQWEDFEAIVLVFDRHIWPDIWLSGAPTRIHTSPG